MRTVMLDNSGQGFSSAAYLVLGGASRLEDVNTVVGVSRNPAMPASLDRTTTGVGKWTVEQVVLTHGHSDHCAGGIGEAMRSRCPSHYFGHGAPLTERGTGRRRESRNVPAKAGGSGAARNGIGFRRRRRRGNAI